MPLPAGHEIGKPGSVNNYFFDLIYISVFVQTLGAFWPPAWWVLLAVPAYALYMLLKKVVVPYFNSAPEPEMTIDAATRKKLEKTEARAERRRNKWR